MRRARLTLAIILSAVISMTTGCSFLFFQCSLAYDSIKLVRGHDEQPVTGVQVCIRVPSSEKPSAEKSETETRLLDLATTNENGEARFQSGHEKFELNIDGDIVLLDLRKQEATYTGAIIGNGKPTKIPVLAKDGHFVIVLPEWGSEASATSTE